MLQHEIRAAAAAARAARGSRAARRRGPPKRGAHVRARAQRAIAHNTLQPRCPLVLFVRQGSRSIKVAVPGPCVALYKGASALRAGWLFVTHCRWLAQNAPENCAPRRARADIGHGLWANGGAAGPGADWRRVGDADVHARACRCLLPPRLGSSTVGRRRSSPSHSTRPSPPLPRAVHTRSLSSWFFPLPCCRRWV